MAFTCVSQLEALIVFDSSESCDICSKKLNGMQLGTTIMLATAPCPLVAKQNVSSEYAFVVFDGPESVLYAMRVLTGTSLFGQKIFVEKRTVSERRENEKEEEEDQQQGAHSMAAVITTSRCLLTGLVPTMFYIDVRDLLEWGAKASVVEMKLTKETTASYNNNGMRQCEVTFDGTNSAKRVVERLHGRMVRGGVVGCVEIQ